VVAGEVGAAVEVIGVVVVVVVVVQRYVMKSFAVSPFTNFSTSLPFLSSNINSNGGMVCSALKLPLALMQQ
jgi:hypothetical protein